MTVYIEDVFDYDPETGWFTNKFSRGRAKADERAGSPSGHGYRKITFNYIKHYEHHLAWLFVYGEYPGEIDHINGIRDDNRIANLRLCTHAQNCYNTQRSTGESGLLGAYLDKRTLKWYSKIQLGNQVTYLGSYETAEEAHLAFVEATTLCHGEFAIINRSI